MKNLILLSSFLLLTNLLLSQGWDPIEYCYGNNKKIVSELNIDSLENVLLDKINTFRQENGLNVLTLDSSLYKYSMGWNYSMYSKKNIEHSNISNYNIIAENVYMTISFGNFPMEKDYVYSISDRIFNGWLSSKKHKENMLNKDVTKIGVSILMIPNGMIDEYSTMVVN